MADTAYKSKLFAVGRFAALFAASALVCSLVGARRAEAPSAPAAQAPVSQLTKAAPLASDSAEPAAYIVHQSDSASSNSELLHDVRPTESADADNQPSDSPAADPEVASGAVHRRTSKAITLYMQVTAYCSCKRCCGPRAMGVTASGHSIRYNSGHFVAADTHILPFGTKVMIPGYAGGKPVEVIDRGGAIKGYHIDIFLPTHEEAQAWGKKWMQVTVLE
jgi:3D (Asp-Asp-Asp) domain-containing protein